MELPKYDECMLPTLEFLKDQESRSGSQITAYLINYFQLNNEQLNIRYSKSGGLVFDDRASWARTYLKKAGLIESPKRSFFKITPLGISTLESGISSITPKYLEQFESFRLFHRSTPKQDERIEQDDKTYENKTPEEMIEDGKEFYTKELQSSLIEKLRELDPVKFERVVLLLMEKMDYGIGSLTPLSHDGGIDVIINEDELGLEKIFLQVKRYNENNKVNEKEMRDFIGALASSSVRKGIFITTSDFSNKAVEISKNVQKQVIRLVNGDELVDLMIKFKIGTRTYKTIEILSVDEDFFEDIIGS